jgi:hypothetical protein
MHLALTNPLPWVLGSLALAVIATNLAWLALRAARRAPAPGGLWGGLEPLIWLLTALFLFLPPIGAWWAGALSPYLMGLSETDWVDSLVSGGVLAAASGGIIVFGWLVYRHKLPARPRAGSAVRPWLAPIDAALLQWHWAFYRALAIALLPIAAGALASSETLRPLGNQLMAAPLYWGSWLGLTLIAVEWTLNPFGRAELKRPGQREIALLRVVLAIATTALFTLAPNFWLLLIAHLTVETVIAGWLPLPK